MRLSNGKGGGFLKKKAPDDSNHWLGSVLSLLVQSCDNLQHLGNALLSWDDLALKSGSCKMAQVADFWSKSSMGWCLGCPSIAGYLLRVSNSSGKLTLNCLNLTWVWRHVKCVQLVQLLLIVGV